MSYKVTFTSIMVFKNFDEMSKKIQNIPEGKLPATKTVLNDTRLILKMDNASMLIEYIK